MKFSGQTKDGAIDNLLRAYVSRPSNPHQVCPDFDPDRANAYIERSLPNAVRLQYEAHLSGCAACRKSVVGLLRMAEADSPTVGTAARQVPQATWLARVKELFGGLSQPQWAMAATAVIVLAVSVPLFLSRNQTREVSETVSTQPPSENAVSAASPSGPGASSRSGQSTDAPATTAKQRENGEDKTQALAKNVPVPTPAAEAVGFAASDEASKKSDSKSAGEAVDETQRKSESQAAPAPAQAGAAPGAQAPRSDADQTRQQTPEKDTAQKVSEPKLAARVNEERAKEKTERTEDVAPPPAAPSSDARERSRLRRPSSLALRDSNTAEAVRPEERKFSGKKFLFREGTWTDKDYNPDKDLPVVTIIRDSNVYKEVMNKRPGLKPFLTGFQATERAIIVYKGTVYKLIPQ